MRIYISLGNTLCPRECLGVHRRPMSTHKVHIKWLFCVYYTFFWTPSSSRLEQTVLLGYHKLRVESKRPWQGESTIKYFDYVAYVKLYIKTIYIVLHVHLAMICMHTALQELIDHRMLQCKRIVNRKCHQTNQHMHLTVHTQ